MCWVNYKGITNRLLAEKGINIPRASPSDGVGGAGHTTCVVHTGTAQSRWGTPGTMFQKPKKQPAAQPNQRCSNFTGSVLQMRRTSFSHKLQLQRGCVPCMQEKGAHCEGVYRSKGGLQRKPIMWKKMSRTTLKDAVVVRKPASAPLHPWQWPSQPRSRLHLDYAGPYMGHMFLVIVDAHSKWLDAHILSSITTTEVLRSVLQSMVCHELLSLIMVHLS